MPRFEYVTQKRKGDSYVKAVIEGNSLADVSIRLNNLNQPIVLITDPSRRTTGEKKERVSLRTKLTFLENLEAAVYLGMDFRTALTICLSTTPTRDRPGKRMAHIIERLRDRVSKGMSFAGAISSYPEVFDEVAIGLISAGEEGGTLTEALTNVRKIWARNEELRHGLLMMLIYPMIVFLAAIGVVWLLMTRVVPQFIGVLGEMHANLPLPTLCLLNLSQFCNHYPLAVLGLVVGSVLLISRIPSYVRRHPGLHGRVLRLPGVGALILLLIRANFVRTFAQLKHARAKTTQALLLCRDLSWNYEYRSAIGRTLVRVQRGESLAAALNDDRDIFGELVINGLAFMEAAGTGSDGLFRLTTLLERQLDSRLAALRQILDPLLIIVLGVIIGGIVFATFLPAMEIMQRI
jgi:type II secretory pathway component PulF